MNKTEKFKKLFEDWKAEQEKESEESLKKTRVDGVSKHSFVYDGIVDNKMWKQDSNKVLFVLKEANGQKDINNDMSRDGTMINKEWGKEFWMKQCVKNESVYNNTKGLLDKIVGMKLLIDDYDSLGSQQIIEQRVTDMGINEKQDILKRISYINLNKRGGIGSSNNGRWKNYAGKDEYKTMIKREIELINPSVIICCGTYEIVLNNVFGIDKKKIWKQEDESDNIHYITIGNKYIAVYNVWHPSAWGAYNNKYYDRLIKSLEYTRIDKEKNLIHSSSK